jgi:hypothetical protein
MSIQNPFTEVEHKVFKRTFLQETEVMVGFDMPMNSEDFSTRVVPFVNKTFKQNIINEIGKATKRVELTSNDSQVKFDFTLNSAKVIIGPQAYKSFATTAIPYIVILFKFLKDVASVSKMNASIRKINKWPIQSKNSKQSFGAAALFIFKKKHIEDILNLKFEESGYPVSAGKEAVVPCGDSTSLKSEITVELENEEKANFTLGLTAQTLGVEVENMMTILPQLNEIVYGAFSEIVTDNIFDLMSKEDFR